jgi:hypothetical protein
VDNEGFPSENLRAALLAEGIDARLHGVLSLRMLITRSLNCPAPQHRTVDQLAEMVLTLSRQGFLVARYINGGHRLGD